MLKKIKIRNFYSVGSEQELVFEIGKRDVFDNSAIKVSDDLTINAVNCFVGHNASGKTTVLKALSFIFWFMTDSYDIKPTRNMPFDPHEFMKDQSSSFELEFLLENSLHRYEIEFNKEGVLREALYVKKQRFNKIFEVNRTVGSEEIKFPTLKVNKSDAERFLERKNVSLISSLIRTGYIKGFQFVEKSESNVTQLGYVGNGAFSNFLEVSEELYKDEELRREVLAFSHEVDLSISDFSFGKASFRSVEDDKEEVEEKNILECVHRNIDGTREFKLDFFQESNGTQHSYFLFTKIFPVLRAGSVIILDEIEDGLHPFVVKKIVSLFENPSTNPNRAQLFFSTHAHILLNDRTKTQIFIAEKSKENFETEVYRLDDIEGVRNDENYFQKFLAGEYGGAPDIKWL